MIGDDELINLQSHQFFLIVRLNEDVVCHIYVFPLVFDGGHKFKHFVHLYLFLLVYLILFLIQETIFEEFDAYFSVNGGQSLRLYDL